MRCIAAAPWRGRDTPRENTVLGPGCSKPRTRRDAGLDLSDAATLSLGYAVGAGSSQAGCSGEFALRGSRVLRRQAIARGGKSALRLVGRWAIPQARKLSSESGLTVVPIPSLIPGSMPARPDEGAHHHQHA